MPLKKMSPPVATAGSENVGRRAAKDDGSKLAQTPANRKPRVFLSGALEAPNWARSAASWREDIVCGRQKPRRAAQFCDLPPSPCNPKLQQGLDPNFAIECEGFIFLGPFFAPYGLSQDERELWRKANLRRIESADLMFVRLGDFNQDDDARRIIFDEVERAAELRVPIYAHECETAPDKANVFRALLRPRAKKWTSDDLRDAFDEMMFVWRETQRAGNRSRRRVHARQPSKMKRNEAAASAKAAASKKRGRSV